VKCLSGNEAQSAHFRDVKISGEEFKVRKLNEKTIQETDELIKSGNDHKICEISPKGEGDYGKKNLWKR